MATGISFEAAPAETWPPAPPIPPDIPEAPVPAVDPASLAADALAQTAPDVPPDIPDPAIPPAPPLPPDVPLPPPAGAGPVARAYAKTPSGSVSLLHGQAALSGVSGKLSGGGGRGLELSNDGVTLQDSKDNLLSASKAGKLVKLSAGPNLFLKLDNTELTFAATADDNLKMTEQGLTANSKLEVDVSAGAGASKMKVGATFELKSAASVSLNGKVVQL
jgi:hypothetical protein